jgi:hypothetical protein
MSANTTFSQAELDAMSEEERQAVEEELQGDTDTGEEEETGPDAETDETQTGGDEGAETGKAAEETAEEETGEEGQEGGDQSADSNQVAEPEGEGEQVQANNQEHQAPQRQPADKEAQDGDQAGEQTDAGAEKKQEFQDKLSTLKEQFEEGEISFEDYLDQRDEVKDQLRELELTSKVRQQLEEDRKQQQQAQLEAQWKQDQKTFFDANQDIQKDPELLKAFQQQANIKIQDPAYDSVSNTELLKQAAQEARAIRGVSAPNNPQQQQTETAKARQRANKKAGEKGVETLSDVPNAAEHDDADAEFAHLDKLMEQGETEKLEQELAKLSPEQETRYLQR